MGVAIKLVGVVVGIVAAVASYGWLNKYMLALLALVGAIAFGIIVYSLVVRALHEILNA